ncbi:endonuclease/exonuclease/phosphatase family protein [Ornithinimicrobium cerasi]|uniref:Metal-dependent hydrolase, endonuclease/exonuclease/phosphatase family n=1 Tax=Ornithinimicrobium cerasi TaxID=2248773 RepID=A0A285VRT5_9MICO|nr:endonuclease/exonuclease/phosphatase family protein [Ornithinimicrobium cerasi]SOC56597.1 Metal-dependent hydrolase, endonuclease/exonuclease/phosphatase family [Ornithinimicrobium cerasi]
MRIATFNVENLFDRARILAADTWEANREHLEQYATLTRILQQDVYAPEDKARIAELLVALGLGSSDQGPLMRLRQNRGRLVTRPPGGDLRIVADGRGDWIGWLELRRESPTELALRHTAQVVADLAPDVIGVVEAEDRTALGRFSHDLVGPLGEEFRHVMLVDGNDERGIDVGLMTGAGYPIRRITSHVDDTVGGSRVFSRDCPEFEVGLPGGGRLVVLVNHLKSKGYGSQAASNRTRTRQATRIRELYDARLESGDELVVVLGDLNDTPDSDPLAPLLGDGGPRDVSTHPSFDDGGWPGTYTTGRAGNKIDYILCSPALHAAITASGVHRRGVWTASGRWEMYPTLTRELDAASDHHALWVDVDLDLAFAEALAR